MNERPRSPAPRPAERTTALHVERVADHLRASGYRVGRDDDGDLAGMWNGHRFWFMVLGERDEILQVRGRAAQVVPADQRSAALLAVNDWNRDKIWPKAYVQEEDDGLALYGEVSVDLEHGVTDTQLARLVDCGLATAVQMFEAMALAQP